MANRDAVIVTVQKGDTLYKIATKYGVDTDILAENNGIFNKDELVVGQSILVTFPQTVHTVRMGETLSSIAEKYKTTVNALFRNNYALNGKSRLSVGDRVIVSYETTPQTRIDVNAYAYPFLPENVLRSTLPYLTFLTPFTYGISQNGNLLPISDEGQIYWAKDYGVAPLMHLSTLTENDSFSTERAAKLLRNPSSWAKLIAEILVVMRAKGYEGIDVDFEYLEKQDKDRYTAFIRTLSDILNPLGYEVTVALAPKTSDNQEGLLYEGHDYAALSAAANAVLLMTYEWGYTYGPPMAVAPIPNVRKVLEYAVSRVPRSKTFMGVPTYGYDWRLPYIKGETKAESLSTSQAIHLAAVHGAEIRYDERQGAPWFRYRDREGIEHEVWFEDARSIAEKLALIKEYGFRGVGYWDLRRPFPQNWVLLNQTFQIRNL